MTTQKKSLAVAFTLATFFAGSVLAPMQDKMARPNRF